MNNILIICPLNSTDLPELSQAEKENVSAWTLPQLANEQSQKFSWNFAAKRTGDPHIIGYIMGRMAADESEIVKLFVLENSRKKGVAEQLLRHALHYLASKKIKTCFLEVRQSNRAARKLYEKFSFYVSGVRKKYYTSPSEDAIMMKKELKN